MNITEYFFVVLSLIAGLSTYCFINKFFSPLPNVIYRLEKFLALSAAVIGMGGTVIGFYLAVKNGFDKESTVLGLSTALPTTIAGISTSLFCGLLLTLKPNGITDNE